VNITSSATFTVTLDVTTTSGHQIGSIMEFSDVATSAALDSTATAQGTGGSPQSGTSATLAQADEVVIVAGAFATGDTSTAITAEVGYTELQASTNDDTSQAGECDYKIVAATTAEACTWTVNAAANASRCCLATFKGAAAGATGQPALRRLGMISYGRGPEIPQVRIF
jgi:hypothetical protein